MFRKLHFLSFTFLCLWLGNAQVPINDLIEDAILVPTEDFTDNNIRLDLATNTSSGSSDCPINSFNRVYYKFTAATNNTVNVSILDSNQQFVDPNSLVVPYVAPDLNQTDESQLMVVNGACSFANTKSFQVLAGQSYYIQVHRANAPSQESNIVFAFPKDGSAADRTALNAFFTANGGVDWTNKVNWTSGVPLGSWYGVTIENGRVSGLDLSNNNVIGNDLSMLPNLDAIQTISLSGNSLNGTVPDLTSITSLTSVNINNNNFTFGDLETNYTANTNLTEFVYQAQNSVDEQEVIEGIVGSDYALTMTPVSGTNVSYQWYIANRFTQVVTDNPVTGATSSVLNFTNLQPEDFNTYVCWATSPIITDLIIKRPSIDITGEVSQAEKDALMIFYNALDGNNWNDNTNWGSTQPVNEWSHVTTSGNRVIALEFFGNGGMTGQIPTEIEDLTALEYLGIGLETGVTGPIPTSIGNLSELRRLRIQGTGNSGSLPASIGNLSKLEELRFIGNNLSGDIPATFENLVSLRDFYLIGSGFVFGGNSNLFTGSLPTFLNSPDLFRIQVSGNDFTGELPDYSGRANLTTLIIDDNLYSFDNLAANQTNNLTIDTYVFSPQRNNSTAQSVMVAPGQSVTFNANANSSSEKVFWKTLATDEYQWFKDNAAIDGAVSSTYTIANPQSSDNGVYYCEITNTDVQDLIIRRADITLNVENTASNETVELADFIIYPNPANDWIKISADSLENAQAEIYDLNGRLIQQIALISNSNILNIENITSGVYFLKITTSGNEIATKRFIKK